MKSCIQYSHPWNTSLKKKSILAAHGASLDVEKKVLRTGKVLEVASATSTEVVIEKAVEETVVKAEATA